ncbi:MAG: hypothetical protein K6T61_10675 [Bryobacteraceae bacterium]|nr:hypothetical protein [Bryobacteraceae bacterium]
MSGSTSKKVVVRRFERDPVLGFVNPRTYLTAGGVEVLTRSGSVVVLPYAEIKAVCFVRDFDASGGLPEPKVFHTRPRTDGLWVRMTFRDGEVVDGLLANNLLQLEPFGFTVVPPNPLSNNQKLFVPRQALSQMHVLGVVGSPLRRRGKAPAPQQIEMFPKNESSA